MGVGVMTLDVMTHPRAERVDREAQRMHANREELAERIARAIRADGHVQPLPGLHHHFKAVTALSPLQYQKRLRLLEARRLLLSEDLDAASAALRVGYRDASHFNREYKNLFGVPPMRDVQRLRRSAHRT